MKQRGFSFVGSTIVYAHMQAVGMVNDEHAIPGMTWAATRTASVRVAGDGRWWILAILQPFSQAKIRRSSPNWKSSSPSECQKVAVTDGCPDNGAKPGAEPAREDAPEAHLLTARTRVATIVRMRAVPL